MAEKKKEKLSVKKLVYNDRTLIICSIIAAIIIWVITAMNLSPETTKSITVPVNIDFSGTLAEQLGIEYYGTEDLTVDVTISCKKYLAKDIGAGDITASLQTGNVTSSGYLNVPIVVTASDDADFSIEKYYPTSASGYFDVAQEKVMTVELNFTNTDITADGYVIGDVVLNQSQAIVKGPRSSISDLSKIVADVSLESELTESQRVNLSPVALDEYGNAVNYATIEAPEGEGFVATIPILKVQNLSPSVTFISGSESAIKTLDVQYSVSSVQVGALESSALETLNLGNISFNDLTVGRNVFEFNPNKVNGVKVLDSTDKVTVTVTVPDNYSKKTISVYMRDINPDFENYDVKINSISSNSVTIIADSSIINNIEKSDLTFTLEPLNSDDGINENTKNCRLVISIGVQGNCWVLGTYNVGVSVTAK